MIAFAASILTGSIGVTLMVFGARAIAEKDFVAMAKYLWGGVLLLTASAAITFANIGDCSYLLMQASFLVSAGKTWAEKTHITKTRNWWPLWAAVLLNALLVVSGLFWGIVASVPTMVQVLGAAAISSALAMESKQRMLMFFIVGRAGMLVASVLKFSMDYTNAAAFVWICLMSWAMVDNLIQLKKVNRW